MLGSFRDAFPLENVKGQGTKMLRTCVRGWGARGAQERQEQRKDGWANVRKKQERASEGHPSHREDALGNMGASGRKQGL